MHNEPIETIKYQGYKIEIHVDDHPENPREAWDNLGTLVCWHRRYTIGDEKGEEAFGTPTDFREWAEENDVIYQPVFMYDHSGITVSTKPFSCRWDSGQLGYIYVTREELRKQAMQDWDDEHLKKVLAGEIEIFDMYLRGEIYGFIVRNYHGGIVDSFVDSCWGFYGEDGYREAVAEAKRVVTSDSLEREREGIEAMATLLANAYA